MQILEEAKKLLEMGKPLAEKAMADFLRKHVQDFLYSGEFEIRKGLGVDEEMGSREYRETLMSSYDAHVKTKGATS